MAPALGTDWDRDFSHELLHDLLRRVEQSHSFATLGDAERALASGDRVAFVRHDVDVSLSRAREMALLEREWNVRATYHVMLRSPFYDPESASGRADLAEIARAGHEVGLHFFATAEEAARGLSEIEAVVDEQCATLERLLGAPVRSVSFHLPPQALIRSAFRVAGRVNAYANELLAWYLSDSCGRWREGDPRESLTKPRSNVLQLLVHPIWWGEVHEAPARRLGAFVKSVAHESGRRFDEVAEQMWRHILFRVEEPGSP